MDIIEKIQERPRSQQIGLWIGSLVVLILIFWQYEISGVYKSFDEYTQKQESLALDIQREQRAVRDLPRYKQAVKQLEARLKEVVTELPDKKEIPSLLAGISGLARDAGLEETLFKPKSEVFRDFYAEVPVSIGVQGSYHQVASFFEAVGKMGRIVNINEIALKEPSYEQGDESAKIKVNCSAVTFRYLDESERRKLQDDSEQTKGKKRKRGSA